MKPTFFFCALLLAVILITNSCKKAGPLAAVCLNNTTVDYLQKWANNFTQTDTYDATGKLQKTSIIHPDGYFQLNGDYSYSFQNDGAPITGKWSVNDSCQLVLNAHTAMELRFTVLKLSSDSLVIRQKNGYTVFTQHYGLFACPALTQLEYRWDNTKTLESFYTGNSITSSIYIYPVGYFTMNPDASYNVVSNNVPYNGTWGIVQPGCKLVLDKGKAAERSFDIQKLTSDSLVIWRKDTAAKVNYFQYYKRH
jgi:hypothetical protein